MKIKAAAFKKGIESKKRKMFELRHGDNLAILKTLNPNQFHSIVTDPPAGIGFMGKDWDRDKGGRDKWIAWLSEIMAEAMRTLKPGGYALVWSLPRTSHWTAMALEDAGFDIRDCIVHLFGSGFPKSHDISKAIDRELGADRETTGYSTSGISTREKSESGWGKNLEFEVKDKPATAAAKWSGYGTALKPAHEMWWLIQKPIAADTIAKNVLDHGVGGLNIDGSRLEFDGKIRTSKNIITDGFTAKHGRNSFFQEGGGLNNIDPIDVIYDKGRFPSNLILSHDGECELECTETCAVRMLDEQSGQLSQCGGPKKTTHDSGMFGIGTPGAIYRENIRGASRFFYTAKPSAAEKNYGLEEFQTCKVGFSHGANQAINDGKSNYETETGGGINRIKEVKNTHPTIKPIKLMQYLIKLITPPGGTVLDPFMGSGTTGVAAIKNGFKFFGIDQEKKYTEIALGRLAAVYKIDPKMFKTKKVKNP